MNSRREFLKMMAVAGIAISLPMAGYLSANENKEDIPAPKEGDKYSYQLFTNDGRLLVAVPLVVQRGCLVSTNTEGQRVTESGLADHYKIFDSRGRLTFKAGVAEAGRGEVKEMTLSSLNMISDANFSLSSC